jgi:cobalt-zinc-cadmium efflux system outer membrane protein
LAAAIQQALDRSPALRAREAEVRIAEAELAGARAYPFNPVLDGSRANRDDGTERTQDREVGLSQEVELAGQRGKRTRTAQKNLESAQARFGRERERLAAEVARAFVDAIRRRELLALAGFEREIARGLAEFEQRRLDAGAGTVVDLNLARAAEGRAERQIALAEAGEIEARAVVAELIGSSPADLPHLAGALPDSLPDPPDTADLERQALARREDLVALRAGLESADARVRLERSLAAPNVVLGVARGREADREDLNTISAGFAIPLFQRNQGGIASAKAVAEGTKAEFAAAELAVRREVEVAVARFAAARNALSVFRQTVAGTLEENLELVQKAFAAGKLRASEVLVFRREFVDSRRELIEAAADAWLSQIDLAFATGEPVPTDSNPSTAAAETAR